ncbi:MAG: DUF1553 domain-containing protein [Planctomycetota bacterium]|nr:MAG: DUF1553 domain-containing protein [Planctomycetota bacterium]
MFRSSLHLGAHAVAAIALAVRLPAATQEPASGLSFQGEVRPILEQRCFACHGATRQKAGLRLDQRAWARAGSKNGNRPVIVPGNSAESLLYQRLVAADEDERMPFGEEALAAEEIEILRRWLDEGAEWPEDGSTLRRHWSYVPPARPALPPVRDDAWPRNGVDRFVLARLEREGLAPSPEAPAETLIRRLYLDLVGLTPPVSEVDEFLADARPDAYERLVERLLASPHYGERQAQLWLDLARYADTNGYEKDERRSQWRYRDWVIDAYNRNLPFDRFTIEQLAGDLLPDATLEQRIATGFHRNTMVNKEGGVDAEEFRVAAVVDRTNTTASVWLGATLGCAQCHDHKYDPYAQEEYYQFFAFFNSTTDSGGSEDPQIEAPTPQQQAVMAELAPQIEALERELEARTPELESAFGAWERRRRAELAQWVALQPRSVESARGATLTVLDDGSVLASGSAPDMDHYVVSAEVGLPRVAGLRIEALSDPSLPSQGPGRTGHGNFVLNEVTLLVDGVAVPLGRARADFEQMDRPWPASGAVDGDPASGWAIVPQTGQSHQAVFALERALPAAHIEVRLAQDYGSRHTLGRFRVSVCAEAPPDAPPLPPALERLLVLGGTRGAPEQAQLEAHWRASAPELEAARARLAQLRARLPQPATCMVLAERAQPRATHVLQKGSFLSPGAAVEPAVPAVLGSLPPDAPRNRLGLAQWLVAPDNPLTARVLANRVWSQYFGAGLSSTPEDFGSQGDAPTHSELLDWLALELVSGGWDVKALHHLIVTSATYRQASRVTPELLERDPYNRVFARGPRFRLEAEAVRDVALSASGLLNPVLGGPSVFPPQPDGIWNLPYSDDRWTAQQGAERHRRALYTFWRRSAPYPLMTNFDAPSREFTCTRRARSNTPLQALNLLNDPAFVEAAAALARRMLAQAGAGDAERAAYGFRLCVARAPQPEEVRILLELLGAQRRRYQADPQAAAALVAGADPDLAAWTVVANVLLNLDETITKS